MGQICAYESEIDTHTAADLMGVSWACGLSVNHFPRRNVPFFVPSFVGYAQQNIYSTVSLYLVANSSAMIKPLHPARDTPLRVNEPRKSCRTRRYPPSEKNDRYPTR